MGGAGLGGRRLGGAQVRGGTGSGGRRLWGAQAQAGGRRLGARILGGSRLRPHSRTPRWPSQGGWHRVLSHVAAQRGAGLGSCQDCVRAESGSVFPRLPSPRTGFGETNPLRERGPRGAWTRAPTGPQGAGPGLQRLPGRHVGQRPSSAARRPAPGPEPQGRLLGSIPCCTGGGTRVRRERGSGADAGRKGAAGAPVAASGALDAPRVRERSVRPSRAAGLCTKSTTSPDVQRGHAEVLAKSAGGGGRGAGPTGRKAVGAVCRRPLHGAQMHRRSESAGHRRHCFLPSDSRFRVAGRAPAPAAPAARLGPGSRAGGT